MTGNRIFNIHGDYIEHQTNNFYDHSQYNSTGAVMNTTKGKDERHNSKSKTVKDTKARELMTFKAGRAVTEAHLAALYSKMEREGWIESENTDDGFEDLFCGKRSGCKFVWVGKYGKGTLVHLFDMMQKKGVISVPDGFSIPNILMGHFVDKDGEFLTNLDKGDAPNAKAEPEITDFVKILSYDPTRLMTEHCSDYDDKLNSYELDKEGMRRR